MLRATYAMLMLLPALVVGYAACAPEDASEENDAVAEAELTTAPRLNGTFRAEQMHYGIALLTLKKDWTFHLEQGVECICAPCIRPELNGTYQMTTFEGANALALYAVPRSTATPVQYLKYILRGDTLYVASTERGALYQALQRSDVTWCAVQNDCAMQDQVPTPCAGTWYCAANACNFTCGPVTCEMENTCEIM